MSELINTRDNRATIRWKLLTGVSAIALSAYLSAGAARAEDNDQPLIWIEVGGQAEHTNSAPELFSPPFFKLTPPTELSVLTSAQKFPPYSTGFDGNISFQPEDSSWVFSAGIRYGRSSSTQHLHRQTAGLPTVHFTFFGKYHTFKPSRVIFADAPTTAHEKHAILDFQAGKDLGLGLFGGHGQSTLSAGVRFAQFTSSNSAILHARPFYTLGPKKTNPGKYKSAYLDHYFQSNTATINSDRNLQAVGPSLSWTASVPLAGNSSDAELNFDWGINAAVLFGKQKAKVHHQTTGHVYHRTGGLFTGAAHTSNYVNAPPDQNRSRTAAVPNVGGFAGIMFRYADAKVSFGYRADMFFGAMDGGIDTRKSEDRSFYGPYASISIGLGD